MTLEKALKELANPDHQIGITFMFDPNDSGDDHQEIVFANLKHALAQEALIAKYEFVSCWNNFFLAK